MRLVVYDGVRYLLASYTDEALKDFHRQLPQIKADIRGMRDSQSGEQKWFHRQDSWDIREAFGVTTVTVQSKSGGEKKYITVKNPLSTTITEIIPYLQCPDGILLCLGGLTFNGPYELRDFYNKGHYDGSGAYYDYYAPYKTPHDNSMSYDAYAKDPLLDGETLVQYQIKDIKETLGQTEYTYNEPDWYGRYSWCPAYWESWEAWSSAYWIADEAGEYLPTDDYGFLAETLININESETTILDTLSWGSHLLPNIYNYYYFHNHIDRTYLILVFGVPIITGGYHYLRDAYSSSGNYGGEIFSRWHTMLYPAPGGCPEDPTVTYWEDCPSVSEFPYGSYQSKDDSTGASTSFKWLAKVSDLESKWAIIYRKLTNSYTTKVWYDYDLYYATPAGTTFSSAYRHEITYADTAVDYVEIRYADSSGVDILLDSGSGQYFANGAVGSIRLYPAIDAKDIFVFGYDRESFAPGGNRCAGISAGGKVNITDLNTVISAGGNSYPMIPGAQFSGILLRTHTKTYDNNEFTVEEI